MSEKPTYAELEQRIRELERHESERQRAEKDICTDLELLSLLLKHSPICVFVKEVSHKESKFLFASENLADIVGVPASRLTGKTMDDLFPRDFAKKITRDDMDVIGKGSNLTVEEELNGRTFAVYKFPVMLGDGKYLAGYAIDITEEKAS